MANILDFLGGDKLQQITEGISKSTGISTAQTSSVIQAAAPLLMGAFQNNSTGNGAMGLLGALQSDKHDGSLLDNLGSLFANGGNNEITKDGANILGHLFGGNQSTVMNAISSKTGVSTANIGQILQTLAPVLMSFFGKKVTENKVASSGDLGGLLSGFLGGNNNVGGILTSLLDANGDGSVLDDVMGMLSGKSGQKGGIGGMLGSLFGKK